MVVSPEREIRYFMSDPETHNHYLLSFFPFPYSGWGGWLGESTQLLQTWIYQPKSTWFCENTEKLVNRIRNKYWTAKNIWYSDSLTGNKYAKLHSTISNDTLSLRFAVLSHNIPGSQKVFKPVQFPDNNNGCFFCANPQKFYANCHAKNTTKWWWWGGGGGTNLRKDHKATRVTHSEPPLDQHMLFFYS